MSSARLSQIWYVPFLAGESSLETNDVLQCVFQVNRATGELTLTELAPGVEVEEVQQKTDAKFTIADSLEIME